MSSTSQGHDVRLRFWKLLSILACCGETPLVLVARALAAFVLLPGVVAAVIPALLVSQTRLHPSTIPFALPALALGLLGLIWCVREFLVSGRGTLAPWDPPQRLVASGPYRYLRNPMYVSVGAVVAGWTLLFPSVVLTVYLAALLAGFHLRVVLREEKRLEHQFPADWRRYAAEVPRWIPRPPRADACHPSSSEEYVKRLSRRFAQAWLALATALALHVADEALTGFLAYYNPAVTALRTRLPWLPLPTFTFGVWIAGLAAGIGLLVLLIPLAARGSRVITALAIPFSALMVANGLGHLGASIYFGHPVPGANSSLLLILASAFAGISAARIVLARRSRCHKTPRPAS